MKGMNIANDKKHFFQYQAQKTQTKNNDFEHYSDTGHCGTYIHKLPSADKAFHNKIF